MDNRQKSLEEAFQRPPEGRSKVWDLLKEQNLSPDKLRELVEYLKFTLRPENADKYEKERVSLFSRLYSGQPRELKSEVKPMLQNLTETEEAGIKKLLNSPDVSGNGIKQTFKQFKKSLGSSQSPTSEVKATKPENASSPKENAVRTPPPRPERSPGLGTFKPAEKPAEQSPKSATKPVPTGGVKMPGGEELTNRFKGQKK